jgi:hypothetical protein
MSYASNATEQPKVYRVNLLVDDSDFDEALIGAIETAASEAGDPNSYSRLKTEGKVDRHLQTVLTAALTDYLGLGE